MTILLEENLIFLTLLACEETEKAAIIIDEDNDGFSLENDCDDSNPDLAELALHGKEELSEKILGKKVHLKNVSTEKYGRILADVFLNDINIGDWLIDQKFAYKYHGQKKLTEGEQSELLLYNF